MYIPETNVLLTRFLADDGIVELTDFMPVDETPRRHCIMRKVTVINGEVRIKLRCAPRFNYARSNHRTEYRAGTIEFTQEGNAHQTITLQSSVQLEIEGVDVQATFILKEGESASFVFGIDYEQKSAAAVSELVNSSFNPLVCTGGSGLRSRVHRTLARDA